MGHTSATVPTAAAAVATAMQKIMLGAISPPPPGLEDVLPDIFNPKLRDETQTGSLCITEHGLCTAVVATAMQKIMPCAPPPPPGLEHVLSGTFNPKLRVETGSQCSTEHGLSRQSSADSHTSSHHGTSTHPDSVPAEVSGEQKEEQPGRYTPGRILLDTAIPPPPPPPAVLALAGAVKSGAPGLPSVGSACHHLGLCKPCDFLHRSSEGCKAGADCKFCHVCGPDENSRRRAVKKDAMRALRQWQYQQARQAAAGQL